MGLGELEERIVRSATEVVLVTGHDLNIRPRVGMWAALAAALGVSELLQGAVFDPDALRIIDPEKAARWFSPMVFADGRNRGYEAHHRPFFDWRPRAGLDDHAGT